jgi:5-(carboxyamino)imidazole ribonucleotide synthase
VIVGVLGAGQLGRMLALSGARLGMRFRFFDEAADAVAGHISPLHVGSFNDADALARFADGCDVVTFEFENVPADAVRHVAQFAPTFPPAGALEVCQDRLHEKTLFRSLSIPTPDFLPVDTHEQFDHALATLGMPCVVKTRRFGYDGKGQAVIRTREDATLAWAHLAGRPLIIEKFVPFTRELSIIAARGRDGTTATYPLAENTHRAGILRVSRAPAANVSAAVAADADRFARAALDAMQYVGVLCIELFEQPGRPGGVLIANEMAPRVHNSGHWTIDASVCSQFENHLRAVAGLPLGDTSALGFAAMVNLIGNCPPLPSLASMPWARLHLYGKEPRPARKIGHINLLEHDELRLNDRLRQIVELIEPAAC